MEVSGYIKIIGDTKIVGSKGDFKKRDLIIDTDEQYPQRLLIEFVQDKCDLLNAVEVGNHVTVSINLRGREWTNPQGETRYFNSIQGWRVNKNDMQGQTRMNEPSQEPTDELQPEHDDDLPF